MKPLLQTLFVLLVLTTSLSCSKDDGYIENPDEAGLTPCSATATCQYLYIENADLSKDLGISKAGNHRIFYSHIINSINYASVFIKAPMKGNIYAKQ